MDFFKSFKSKDVNCLDVWIKFILYTIKCVKIMQKSQYNFYNTMKLKYCCIVLVRDHPEQNGSSEPLACCKDD